MNGSELTELGLPKGEVVQKAQRRCGTLAQEGYDKEEMRDLWSCVASHPEDHTEHELVGDIAERLVSWNRKSARDKPIQYADWTGNLDIDEGAITQIQNGCRIPTVTRGAIMPDAHRGYSVPIGGVLESEALMPGAVGVDIACRMKMSVIDIPGDDLEDVRKELREALVGETSFGIGSHFDQEDRRDHSILDDSRFRDVVEPLIGESGLKDKAWKQLGSSGSGNHFAEWGVLTVGENASEKTDVPEGTWIALLTHSGSRGLGAMISDQLVSWAEEMHPELESDLRKLGWIESDTPRGEKAWKAMTWAGDYAEACHEVMHESVLDAVDCAKIGGVENHHNYAWKEDGKFVHRKGATPAREGELGVIPGTMIDSCYVVEGKGCDESIRSASHGAGRVMSRSEAKRTLDSKSRDRILEEAGVEVIGAGLDEDPRVYKNIDDVMDQQSELVEKVAEFKPKIVRMADPDETPPWLQEED
jgi:tRNA-splicing ligase RtcB